jgi:hypothetical protein
LKKPDIEKIIGTYYPYLNIIISAKDKRKISMAMIMEMLPLFKDFTESKGLSRLEALDVTCQFGGYIKTLTMDEKLAVIKSFDIACQPPKVDPSVSFQECVVCSEPKRIDKRHTFGCSKRSKATHSICLTCYDSCIKSCKYSPGSQIMWNLHKCPLCTGSSAIIAEDHVNMPPTLLAKLLDLKENKDTVDTDQVQRFCSNVLCMAVFDAGPKLCARDGLDGLESLCEKCKPKLFFRCPACDIPLEKESGCDLIRCCIYGYHGCPKDGDDEAFCDACSTDSGKGCGHVFEKPPTDVD